MTDAYTMVRKELSALIVESGVSDFTAKDIHCTGRACEASAWLPLDGERLWELAKYMRGAGACLGDVRVVGHRLEFELSQAFYDEMLHRVEGAMPAPRHVDGPVAYAYARMRMLARKDGQGVPDVMKRTFWLALGLAEQGLGAPALAHRLRLTAGEALRIGEGLTLKERDELLNGCGPAAAGIARLMYGAMPIQCN